ncbi:MAG: trypsin-like peptidase domain-containing protein [Candidatus Promineifilaceae bacterium]
MQLTDGSQWRELTNALGGFKMKQLERMLRFELNQDLEEIALGDNKREIIFKVVEEYNYRDQVELLVLAARRFHPQSRPLQIVAQELGVGTNVEVNAHRPNGSFTSQPVKSSGLEDEIRAVNPMVDVKSWIPKLLKIENQICRIEDAAIPFQGVGTGFLVGKNTVLTNFHVIKRFVNDADKLKHKGTVRVRFDYALAADGLSMPAGVDYEVEAILDVSHPHPLEGNPASSILPEPDQLDYALLLIKGEPGNEPIGGFNLATSADKAARGWITLTESVPSFEKGGPLFIYQHPKGARMKLALETNSIIGTNANDTRVYYRTNTEPGSSGSPCFDFDWNLIALHHGYAWFDEHANRGIPINKIYQQLIDRGMGNYIAAEQPA